MNLNPFGPHIIRQGNVPTVRSLLLALLIAAAVNPAAAAVLSIKVVTPEGRPVADAVVTLKPVDGPATPPKVGRGYRVDQKDIQFHPFVSVVPVGAEVSFPNLDPTKHHVYSFSPAKRFELKLFAKDQSRSVVFDKSGVVSIGCNIHDQMSAYIFVTDTAWTAKTDASGVVTFRDAPARAVTAAVWHPSLRAPGGVMSRQLTPGAAPTTETFTARLRPPPVHGMSAY